MNRITLAERGEQLRRKLAAGVRAPEAAAMANGGRRRTDAKRALLQRLRDVAAERGMTAPFKATS
ncbi:hypothetical protein [Roseicella aquatilis]|uniref:Uncharacterized protein n=1 Tax=Roseicella aquatilis TaxID=2527868 RepID=A0A4R4DQF8_9PROT|nr:hypothetical protein [Roseicella aquatilis]TCZ64339.1 hypothetical protein EXY23_06735 [Roseicella aquatilis]